MTKTAKKPFFYLDNSEIEYSTDFDFFLKNQIWTSQNREGYFVMKFNSRLEAREFTRVKKIFNSDSEFTQKEIVDKCREIHNDLMAGKYGTPNFVD